MARQSDRKYPNQTKFSHWSDAEKAKLKELWGWPMEYLKKQLPGRTAFAIKRKARKMGLRRKLCENKKRFSSHPLIKSLIDRRFKFQWRTSAVARKIGESTDMVSRLERGEFLPRFRLLTEWCEALRLELVVVPTISAYRAAKRFTVSKQRAYKPRDPHRPLHPVILALVKRRRSLNVSTKEVARALGKQPTAFNRLECCKYDMLFVTLSDWCDILGMKLEVQPLQDDS